MTLHLQNEESFSFNSTSTSKPGLFSDDEEGGAGGDHHHYCHRENDYFEISLPSQPSLITKTNDYEDDVKEEGFEFWSTLNSSSVKKLIPTPHHPKPATTTSSAVPGLQIENHYHKKVSNLFNNHGCMIRSPRCHQGLFSPFPDGQQVTRLRIFDKSQRNSARFGGIRNSMVKLIEKVNKKTSMDCKVNILDDIQRDSNHMVTKNNKSPSPSQQHEKSSKSGFNKMFGVFMKRLGICRRSKHAGSKSCPVTSKSSPMHGNDVQINSSCDERRNSFYLKDHSIQAAIAHCKKSFGK